MYLSCPLLTPGPLQIILYHHYPVKICGRKQTQITQVQELKIHEPTLSLRSQHVIDFFWFSRAQGHRASYIHKRKHKALSLNPSTMTYTSRSMTSRRYFKIKFIWWDQCNYARQFGRILMTSNSYLRKQWEGNRCRDILDLLIRTWLMLKSHPYPDSCYAMQHSK